MGGGGVSNGRCRSEGGAVCSWYRRLDEGVVPEGVEQTEEEPSVEGAGPDDKGRRQNKKNFCKRKQTLLLAFRLSFIKIKISCKTLNLFVWLFQDELK